MSDPRELGGYPAWRAYVASIADAYRGFAGVGAAAPAAAAEGAVASGARTLVVFAPHPDDEAITGAFALRARDETGARVVVAAATLGSNPARKSARLAELRASCSRSFRRSSIRLWRVIVTWRCSLWRTPFTRS